MPSGGGSLAGVFAVAPGGGLVVAGAGLEASVQDADESAGQSSQGVVVLESLVSREWFHVRAGDRSRPALARSSM
jgi:hypothetical protein